MYLSEDGKYFFDKNMEFEFTVEIHNKLLIYVNFFLRKTSNIIIKDENENIYKLY